MQLAMFSSVKKIPSTNSLNRYDVTNSALNETIHAPYPLLLKYHNFGDTGNGIGGNVSTQHSAARSSSLGRSDSVGSFRVPAHRKLGDKSLALSFDNIASNNDVGCNLADLSTSSRTQVHRSSFKSDSGCSTGNSDDLSIPDRLNSGIVGLHNLGNTCFMNCIIQCLSHTRSLLEYCLSDAYRSDLVKSSEKGQLMKSFSKLVKALWEDGFEGAVSPTNFRSKIQHVCPRFAGYTQQDAQEFLRYLLHGLHEDINKAKKKDKLEVQQSDSVLSESIQAELAWKQYLSVENSMMTDVFVGQLKSTLTCTYCHHSSVTFDPFWDLSLPIPKGTAKPTLCQCLNLFMEEEFLDGNERPTCVKCKTKRKCSKRFTIHKFPKILVLHLKRFSSSSERFRMKLGTMVEFPCTGLDIAQFGTNKGVQSSTNNTLAVYNLYAVVNHMGSAMGGHYTAYCSHPYSGVWHEFDDSRATRIGQFRIVSPEAYILFYELTNQSSKL